MNKQIILKYYLREVPERHYAFQVFADGQGQTIGFYYCAPDYNKPEPSDNQLAQMEADALVWYGTQVTLTYDALFKLLPRAIRAQAQLFKDQLKADNDPQTKVSGYMLAELERDISTGELYNDGDPDQRAEFDGIRALFVSGNVLTQAQADTWGNLEVVE